MICALAAAAPVGVALYSLVGTDIWDARDLYASVPAAALLLGALIAAIPLNLRWLAAAAVFATLVAGAARAISPTYSRPPFRAAAHYLDQIAAPRDPIIMYPSFLGLNGVLPVELQKPHVIVYGAPKRWPTAPAGGLAVAILDGTIAELRRGWLPRPSGYVLSSHRQYRGALPFVLLIYRPPPAPASA